MLPYPRQVPGSQAERVLGVGRLDLGPRTGSIHPRAFYKINGMAVFDFALCWGPESSQEIYKICVAKYTLKACISPNSLQL